MDPVSIATALVGSQMADVQMAVAAKMLRMNADNASAIAPAEHAPPRRPQKINLDKGRVSLAKRQTVSLIKTGARLRCGGSRWAWLGPRQSRAQTSTSTRR